jgi:hypothetical protein
VQYLNALHQFPVTGMLLALCTFPRKRISGEDDAGYFIGLKINVNHLDQSFVTCQALIVAIIVP